MFKSPYSVSPTLNPAPGVYRPNSAGAPPLVLAAQVTRSPAFEPHTIVVASSAAAAVAAEALYGIANHDMAVRTIIPCLITRKFNPREPTLVGPSK